MGLTETIVEWAIAFISSTGYFSVFFLMVLESMIAPIPSEAVMPFAGFLIVDGQFTWTSVILVSTFGSIIGSLISYYLGAWGGRPIIEKFGKYLLLDNHHLELTENYFNKKGELTIFICRFIPVVRHLISLPAGMGRMNITKFIIYTTIGAALWNTFLTWVGYTLKKNWREVMTYSHSIDIIVLVILAGIIAFFAYSLVKQRNKKA